MNNGRSIFKYNPPPEEKEQVMVAKRFYFALILCDLVNEKTVWDVSKKYRINRGNLQRLMASASMFSGMMVRFCHTMKWSFLECILSQYSKRLGFGVKSDILELVQIEGVGQVRARALCNAGFKDVKSIAQASPNKLVKKLKKKLGPAPKA
jgi:replicative superfamily II helicase